MKTNEEKSRALALVAGFFSVVAYITYSWNTLTGATHPNISSWTVWAFLTVLNFTSYKKVTGDWVKSLLPTINSGLCILTTIFAFGTGSFLSLSVIDWVCLMIGVAGGILWFIYKSATFAQILVQIAIVIGFIPTIAGVFGRPSSEPWVVWLMWTTSFTIQYFVVKSTWKGKYMEFLYPINMVLSHGVVFVLTLL